MGDRCYLVVECKIENADRLWSILIKEEITANKLVEEGYATEEPNFSGRHDQGVIAIGLHEANYALYIELEAAAKKGIPFRGCHDAGDNYPRCQFYSRKNSYLEWEAGREGGLVLEKINQEGFEALREFENGWNSYWRSPLQETKENPDKDQELTTEVGVLL